MMAKAIRLVRTGGPEVLEHVDVEVGEPGPGEARVRQHAIGLNFIDVYFRTGLYPMPLPSGLGQEGAGVVEAVGDLGAAFEGPGGWSLTVPALPDTLVDLPDFGTLGEFNLFGSVDRIGVVAVALLVFTLMLADFFDTMGTMTAIGAEAGLLDQHKKRVF